VKVVSLAETGGPITVKDYVAPQATMNFDFVIKNTEPVASSIPAATNNFAVKCYMADNTNTMKGTEVQATVPVGGKDAPLAGNNAQLTLTGTVTLPALSTADCPSVTKYCCRVYAPNPPNNYGETDVTDNKICMAAKKNCKPGKGSFSAISNRLLVI
jgi:hypothetical protein